MSGSTLWLLALERPKSSLKLFGVETSLSLLLSEAKLALRKIEIFIYDRTVGFDIAFCYSLLALREINSLMYTNANFSLVFSWVLNCTCVTFGFCFVTLCAMLCCWAASLLCYGAVWVQGCVCTCESRVGGEGWISLFWARAPDSWAANKGGKRPGEGEWLWVSIGTPSTKIWVWEGNRTQWRKTAAELCNWRLG